MESKGPREQAWQCSRSLAATAVAATLLAAGAAARLWSAYGAVPNRYAFGWDSSRRALLNIHAGDALARLDLPRLLLDLAGPETWPTLRMVFAAPLVATFGPSLELESALTVAHYAALFFVLGLAAALLARGPSALFLLAVSAATLAANRALLGYAATGMLEVLSALTTLAAAVAWIVSRESGSSELVNGRAARRGLVAQGRLWPVALLGNLVFHTKWQHGVLFAATVLLVEAASVAPGDRRRALAGLAAAARAARRHALAWIFLAAGVVSGAVALGVARMGGGSFAVAGIPVIVRDLHGPFFWAAFALFYGLQVELWRSRSVLREAVPHRLRTLWVWLATPMAVWLLVPFTWRLRTILVTSAQYDSHAELPAGLLAKLAFYPEAMWRDWYAPPARVAVAAMLVLAALAAIRDAAIRRRLVPLAAIAVVELLVLALGSRANFQARFALNLAPLFALAAALPMASLSASGRAGLGAGTAALVGAAIVPLWREPALASALSQGFAAEEVAASCRPIAAALAYRDATLVNETPPGFVHDCTLAVVLDARRRGVRLELAGGRPGTAPEVVLLDGCNAAPPPALAGFDLAGPKLRRGQVCGSVLRRR